MFLCIVKYDCLIYHHQLMETRHKKFKSSLRNCMTFYVGNFLRDRLLLENIGEVNFFSIRDLERGEFSKSLSEKWIEGGKTRLDDIREVQDLSLSTSRIACLGNERLPQCGNDPGKRGRLVRLQWA